jgi:hypothetical protein
VKKKEEKKNPFQSCFARNVMEFRGSGNYELTKPEEASLWRNQTMGYRLWKAGSLGAVVGAFAAAVTGYWYDYPPLKPTDGYKTAAWASAKMTGKVAFAFASAALVYQTTVEIVNEFQERRTALGPFLGGTLGCMTLGMTSAYFILYLP